MARQARGGRKPATVFNMSFLDLLACTLGALIFIMILLFLQLSGLVPTGAASAEAGTDVERERAALERKTQETRKWLQDLEDEIERFRERERTLRAALERVETAPEKLAEDVAALRRRVEAVQRETAALDAQVKAQEERRRRFDTAREQAARPDPEGGTLVVPTGSSSNPAASRFQDVFHVVCDAQGVVVTHEPSSGEAQFEEKRVAVKDLDKRLFPFQQAVDAVKKHSATHLMILWVRPDGLDTYRTAYGLASKEKINLGDEPADADWNFRFGRGGK